MSACTVELIGSMFLYFGYIYFNETDINFTKGAVYYGVLCTVLNFATFELTGGCFNLALLLGGVIFDSAVDKRYIGMFVGGLLGCLIARLLHHKLFNVSQDKNQSSAIKMLLKEEENLADK